MDASFAIGLAGLAVLLALIAIRVPIAYTMFDDLRGYAGAMAARFLARRGGAPASSDSESAGEATASSSNPT